MRLERKLTASGCVRWEWVNEWPNSMIATWWWWWWWWWLW